jgi:hypothetical protein
MRMSAPLLLYALVVPFGSEGQTLVSASELPKQGDSLNVDA